MSEGKKCKKCCCRCTNPILYSWNLAVGTGPASNPEVIFGPERIRNRDTVILTSDGGIDLIPNESTVEISTNHVFSTSLPGFVATLNIANFEINYVLTRDIGDFVEVFVSWAAVAAVAGLAQFTFNPPVPRVDPTFSNNTQASGSGSNGADNLVTVESVPAANDILVTINNLSDAGLTRGDLTVLYAKNNLPLV